jgi:hypothetical protein
MKRTSIIVGLLLGLSQTAESASNSADNQNTEGSKGTTVEDLGRGLKSAAQNVEKEIPKIGSAIGNAVKKMTEKEPGKQSSQEPSRQKK